jgi:cell division transport system permease protein
MNSAAGLFDGAARGLRQLSGSGDAELVPQVRLSGPMPWVIAIMIALTLIAAAAGLALRNTAQATARELEGGVTIQIIEASPEAREKQTAAAIAHLRSLPGFAAARLVPQGEVDALVEPWLGERGSGSDIPVPALIDARIAGAVDPARLAGLQEGIRAVAPSARVDAQSAWLTPVFDAIKSLQLLVIVLVVLLAGALASSVLLAARSALGANRDTIEIVHLLGGTDAQIARVFQRSIGIDAAGGGAVGSALALVVILFLGRQFASLGAGMVDSGALGWTDWALLAIIPLAAIALAVLTARLTVLHTLRKML